MPNNPQEHTDWEKLPGLPAAPNPCTCCAPIAATLPLDAIVAVGFGSAVVTRDGDMVLDGERAMQYAETDEEIVTVGQAEALAAADPQHDWRIELFGPLHGETYQRQGPASWVLVERNKGFA